MSGRAVFIILSILAVNSFAALSGILSPDTVLLIVALATFVVALALDAAARMADGDPDGRN
jgi:hypothetical protein